MYVAFPLIVAFLLIVLALVSRINHPVNIVLTGILLATNSAIFSVILLSRSWFFYAHALVYLGSIIVLARFVVSTCTNYKQLINDTSTKGKILLILLVLANVNEFSKWLVIILQIIR